MTTDTTSNPSPSAAAPVAEPTVLTRLDEPPLGHLAAEGPEPTAPEPAADTARTPSPAARVEQTIFERLGGPPRTPLLLGLAGSVLMVLGGFGAGGVLAHDPLLTNSALGFWRYGHGREIAIALFYLGLLLLAYAWMRLGRGVLAHRVGGRAVLTTAAVWMAPMLLAAPMYTRDVFSYLAQGALPLAGFDPYAVGPEVLTGPIQENVHPVWQDTPAPYGPLFILIAKAVAAVTGDNLIAGVVLMRLVLLPGLLLLIWALPELTQRMGGRIPVTLWIAVANPIMVVHMVGGIHNDLLVVGLLAAAALLTLRSQHAGGIALASAAMAIKASAGLMLPFLVLVWAAHLPTGSRTTRILRAGASGIAVFVAVFAACTLVAGVGMGWLPALSAPAMIIHWYSAPTGVGLFVHAVVDIVADVRVEPFINVSRAIGVGALLVIGCRHWWAARDDGPDAIRRAGIVLLAAALLGPTLLSWYPSWGMVLLAMTAWSARGLAMVVFCSLCLMIVTYPDGGTAQYNAPLLILGASLWALAAASLLWPDPLRRLARIRLPAPELELMTAGAERRSP